MMPDLFLRPSRLTRDASVSFAAAIALLLLTLLASGCAGSAKPAAGLAAPPAASAANPSTATTPPAPATQPVASTTEGSDMGKPFMFREAGMPPGFPEPGPVGVVVVKQYPAYRHARITRAARPEGSQDSMFMGLFRHIKNNKIEMTSPVEMEYAAANGAQSDRSPRVESMAFLYGDQSIGQTGMQGEIEVADVPPMQVLSVTVRGSYEPKAHAKALDQLNAWLTANPGRYRVVGPPRYLGYNSPFVPWFLRIGEVQLPVESLR